MVVRIASCDPSPPPPQSMLWDALESVASLAPSAPPGPVNWRDDSSWPVGDQGSSGACVGWAVGNGLLNWWFRKKGLMQPADHVSPRFLWLAAIATSETDTMFQLPATVTETEPTTIKNALRVASKFGCLKEPQSPPQFWQGPPLPSDASPVDSLVVQEPRVKWLGIDALVWSRWLVKEGPIVVRIDMDLAFEFANPGASRLTAYSGRTGRGHAVVIVGRQSDGDFIVRNSWGPDWADQGFALASPAYLLGQPGITPAAVTEAWGVYSSI